MKSISTALGAALFAMALATSPALAHPPVAERSVTDEKASFEADRADILAMSGNFKVRFDMQESTRWDSSYTPLEPKVSGGHEVVRVVEDTGRKISLQHLLVIEHDGQVHIIKHWRQDWIYEPAQVLVYSDRGTWALEDVPEKMRKGRWSQTVWQVDDSPRYGGWGQFEEQGGIRRWRSNWTWRPLARRDAVRKPVYDRYYAINRHQPSPDGWVHWQDNTKMGVKDGKLVPIVQEYVLNTYTKFDGYNVKAADDYWGKTKGYWAEVRKAWDEVIAKTGGIKIAEEAETGSPIASQLLSIAEEIIAGTTSEKDGVAEARLLISEATGAAL